MPHTPNHNTNLVTQEGQFINRRTGLPVPAGTLYHIHPDKGPMEGGVHNPNITGGTAGHDFFDVMNQMTTNGRNNMSYRRRGTARRTPSRGVAKRRTPSRGVARKRTPSRGVARRRGAAAHTPGHNNGCGPGMMMSGAGQCVPVGSARRGSRRASKTRGAAYHTPEHTQQMMNQNRMMNNGGYRRGGASRVSSLRGRRGAAQQYNPSQEANFINAAGVPYYCPPGYSYGSGFCVEKSPLDSQFSS